MIRRALLAVAALCAFATAVVVAVVALAFALYALVVADLGPAGAAAVVAAVAAVLAGFGALMLTMRGRAPPPEPTILDRVTQIARERPLLAAGGALVAGLVALKNPKLVAGLASAFMAGKAADKADPRRRR